MSVVSDKLYYQKNREQILLKKKKSYEENKEKLTLANKKCYKKNRAKRLAHAKIYYLNNKQKRLEYDRNYRINHEDSLREYRKNYAPIANARRRERKKHDPAFIITSSLRDRISDIIRTQFITKSTKTMTLIDCSIEHLKLHLESQFYPHPVTGEQMTWENHGNFGWHIDHIKPCNTFTLTDPEQQRQCFHWTNLRPLLFEQNLSRPKDGRDLKFQI